MKIGGNKLHVQFSLYLGVRVEISTIKKLPWEEKLLIYHLNQPKNKP